jgi:hypothetical protein
MEKQNLIDGRPRLLQAANLALRFLLELCALGALGWWGFSRDGAAGRLLGPGLPVVAANRALLAAWEQ